ncbi:probable 2-oxoglutarate-dependent dioxygenase AOP1.2 [Eucalyptus grandis]|uniref:probable 2-oxoglutarate-dependent dioxygenase AOP1.2 n=1 Tax=Eucalyptus grandis TaxID=71139 RepID=UPI00192EF7E4|nr:probable 2-oxoglutarate-dependent dioxygenase AOP1.2 [Eucalyptus grandis]
MAGFRQLSCIKRPCPTNLGADQASIGPNIIVFPVIDLSSPGLEPGTAEWTAARDGVKRALESYGCFEARFEKVPAEMQASMLGLVREVFDLPLQTKLRNVSSEPLHGYVGQYPVVPLYESIGIEDADVYEKVDGLTTTLWPEGHPSFRLHSPHHQVMISGNEARYSAALFSIPKGGYIIKAPDELMDEEHPLLFKPFDTLELDKAQSLPSKLIGVSRIGLHGS